MKISKVLYKAYVFIEEQKINGEAVFACHAINEVCSKYKLDDSLYISYFEQLLKPENGSYIWISQNVLYNTIKGQNDRKMCLLMASEVAKSEGV